jgi:hypothetical protein
MRTPNLGTAFYAPGVPPDDPAQLSRFLQDELTKLAAAVQALAAGQLDKTTVAPAKPREGMVRLADGSNWNPGSGQGVYAYYNGAWHLLG